MNATAVLPFLASSRIAAERDERRPYVRSVAMVASRLKRFNQVLFWPERGFQGPDGCGFLNYLLPDGPRIDEAPCIKQWLLESVDEPDAAGAAVLDLSIPLDCNVVWEAADLVARMSYNMYFGDGACAEVYLVHHHDKVVISIPDKCERDNLIRELSDDKAVFVDRSDY